MAALIRRWSGRRMLGSTLRLLFPVPVFVVLLTACGALQPRTGDAYADPRYAAFQADRDACRVERSWAGTNSLGNESGVGRRFQRPFDIEACMRSRGWIDASVDGWRDGRIGRSGVGRR